MPRQVRLDAPGTLHYIIVRGLEKRRIVDDNIDRTDFVNRMGEIAADTGTVIYTWALLTNHAYILCAAAIRGSSRPGSLEKIERLQIDFPRRLAARGYYVPTVFRCIPAAVPGPS